LENIEENSEKIWKLWKKDKLNSEKIWKIQKKIVKWYGKYGWNVKWYGKYGRK
jgi:outer membrane protein assembly factor BamA